MVKLVAEILARQEQILTMVRAHLHRVGVACLPPQNLIKAEYLEGLQQREHNLFRFVALQLVHKPNRFLARVLLVKLALTTLAKPVLSVRPGLLNSFNLSRQEQVNAFDGLALAK